MLAGSHCQLSRYAHWPRPLSVAELRSETALSVRCLRTTSRLVSRTASAWRVTKNRQSCQHVKRVQSIMQPAAVAGGQQGVSLIFSASTVYCLPLFAMMLLLPRSRVTISIMHSDWIFVPLSVMYIVLLAQSWTPETLQLIMPGSLQAGLSGKFNPQFFPKLEGIQVLFAQATTAASLWVHLLSINLFAARTAYLQGLHDKFASAHSVLLSVLFGPLGLLSHLMTQALWAANQSAAATPEAGPAAA